MKCGLRSLLFIGIVLEVYLAVKTEALMTPLPEMSQLGLRRDVVQDQLVDLGDVRPDSLTPRIRK